MIIAIVIGVSCLFWIIAAILFVCAKGVDRRNMLLLRIIKAVKVAKVANTEAKAANNVMDEYVATPENAGMPNAVKRESRDNLILSY